MILEAYKDFKGRSIAEFKCVENQGCSSKFEVKPESFEYLLLISGNTVTVTVQVDKFLSKITGGILYKVNDRVVRVIMPVCVSKECELGLWCK